MVLVWIVLGRRGLRPVQVQQGLFHPGTDLLADFGGHECITSLAADDRKLAADQPRPQVRIHLDAPDLRAILEIVEIFGLDPRHLVRGHQLFDLRVSGAAFEFFLLAAVGLGVARGLLGGGALGSQLRGSGSRRLLFLATGRLELLLALVAFGALHLLFGDQAGFEELIAQGEAHAFILSVPAASGYDSGIHGVLTMQRFSTLMGLAMLVSAPLALAVPDESGALVDPGTAAAGVAGDPQLTARLNYNVGFEEFENTRKLEMAASSMTGAALRAQEERIQKGFSEARLRFRAATAADPQMRQAWNMLGYTSRRLGAYEESLTAYDRALALQPDYPEAIEYRAELFLLTGRFDDVKTAYGVLLQSSPAYAEVLKASMQQWVASKDVPGASAPGRAAFVAWVATL